jgi:hypothetical protein
MRASQVRSIPVLAALLASLAGTTRARADDEPLREPRAPKAYGRVLQEYVVFNGLLGIPWYWYTQDFSQRNWDLRWDGESWRRKAITFDAVRFDWDDFRTNAVHHTFVSGMTYYVVARTNHLTIGESFLMSIAASTAWEYLVEFREMPSLNDMVTTPMSGLTLGEVFFQLGEFFRRGGDHPVNWTLAGTFGAMQGLHARLDHTKDPRSAEVDDLGFALDRWHRFELSAAIAQAWLPDERETRMELGLDTEIVTIPSWEREGQASRWIGGEGFTRLIARVGFHDDGLRQGLLRARATVGGYYDQDLGVGGAHGHALFVGFANTFEYANVQLAHIHDRLAIVGLPGFASDLVLHAGAVRLRASLDVAPDFAMVSALAGPAFLASLGEDGLTKSTLQHHGYYYAIGATVAPSLHLDVEPLSLKLDARLDTFSSIDGFDRRQDLLTSDAHLGDRRLSYRAALGLRPLSSLQLSVAAEERVREGWVGTFRSSYREHVITLASTFLL